MSRVHPRPEDLSRYAKPRLSHAYVALPHARKPQSQYISAFRSYLVLLYSYNVSDFCSIAQFRISLFLQTLKCDINSASAGSHFTLFNSSLVSHLAASCSFRCNASVTSEHR